MVPAFGEKGRNVMKQMKKLAVLLVLSCFLMIGTALTVSASMTVKQTGATSTSVKFSWNSVSGAVKYKLAYYRLGSTSMSQSNPRRTVVSGTRASFNNVATDAVFGVAVEALDSNGYTIDYTPYWTRVGTTPGGLGNFKVTNWSRSGYSCTIIMPKNNNPNTLHGVEWRVYNGSELKCSGTKTGTISFSPNNVTATRCYTLKVRGWMEAASGQKFYGAWNSYALIPQPINMKGTISSAGKSTLSWTKVAGATYYDVYMVRGNSSSGFKKVASKVRTSRITLSSFSGSSFQKDYTGYSYYVVARRVVNGKTYSSPSSNYYHYYYRTVYS